MRGLLTAALLAGCFLTMSQASAATERVSDSDSHRILGLEDRWAQGLPKRDGALFEKLLAPGFVYTENDQMMGRDELLHELMQGSDQVRSARNEGMQVHSYGRTAVVTGWLVTRGAGAHGRFHRRYRFTDTWMRYGEDWKIIAAHDYIAPTGSR